MEELSGTAVLSALLSFWVLASILVIMVLMFVWVAYENLFGTTVTIIAAFLVLQFFGKIPLFGFIVAHPETVILYLVFYTVAGVVWSIVKWWLFCKEAQEAYEDTKEEFFRRKRFTVMKAGREEEVNPQEAWREYCKYAFSALRDGKLWARDYKARVVMWIIYWPWSLVWTFLDDIVRRILNAIYTQIQWIYQAITDNAFKNITKDFESSAEDR